MTQNKHTYRLGKNILVVCLFLATIAYTLNPTPSYAAAGVNNSITLQGKVVNADGTNVVDGAYDFSFQVYNGAGSGASSLFTENWTNAALFTSTMSTAPGANGESVVYGSNTNESSLKVGQILWNTTKQEAVTITAVDTGTNTLTISPTLSAWAISDTITNRIYVKDGIFRAAINSLNQNWGTIDFGDDSIFVGINFNADGEMKPRIRFSSVPYSMTANNSLSLGGITAAGYLRSNTDDTFEAGHTLTVAGDIDMNGAVSIADTDITLDGATTNLAATGDFSINTDDFFINKSTGNVAIGSASPGTAKLHVTGDFVATGSLSVGSTTTFNSQTYTWPGSQTAGYVLQTNGTGTLSWADPAALAGGTNYWQINAEQISPKNALWHDLLIGGTSTASAKIALQANTGNVTTTGKLGINTTTPSNLLEIRPTSGQFTDAFYYNGTAYTNNTTEAQTTRGTSFTLLSTNSSMFYVNSSSTFNTIYIGFATNAAGATLGVEYWNGSAWTSASGLSDGTTNLTASGSITFTTPSDWATTTVNGRTGYFARLTTSTSTTTNPTAYVVTPNNTSPTSIYAQSADTTPSFLIEPDGNVAIGYTTAGSYGLRVNGTAGFSGTVTGGNFSSSGYLRTTSTSSYHTIGGSTQITGTQISLSNADYSSTYESSFPIAVGISPTWNETSGTLTHVGLNISPTLNQTGTANGDYTALQIQPTVTAATGTNKRLIRAGTAASPDMFVLNDTGNLTLSGDFALNGGDLTSTGALTITPNAGSNLNVVLSGAGDFAVNTNQLYIDTSTARVGIGNAAPSYTLDTAGDINTTGAYRISGTDVSQYFITSAGTSGEVWKSDGTGAGAWGSDVGFANPMTTAGDIIFGGTAGAPTRLAGSGTDNLVLKYDTDTAAPYWGTDDGGTTYTASNGITLATADFQLGGALTQNTTITQDSAESLSFVNAGTANTIFNLSSTGDFDIQDNGTSAFFVRDDGNVGIGTNAPDYLLSLKQDDPTIFLEDSSGGSPVNVRIQNSSGSNAFNIYDITNSRNIWKYSASLDTIVTDASFIANTTTNTIPLYISRTGSTTESLAIGVDDTTAYLTTLQDEDSSGSYGSLSIRLGNHSSQNPNFVVSDYRTGSAVERFHLDVDTGTTGINTSAPDKALEVNSSSGDNLRLTYNDSNGTASNYTDFSLSSSGDLTITPSGGDVNITGNLAATGDINTTGAYRINGTDVSQYFITSAGTSGEVWKSDGTGAGAWGTDVGFANPMTTAGDIIFGGTAGVPTRLAGSGTDNLVLKYDTDTAAPYWGTDNGGTTYTASNGITLATADFQLGGALTQNTTITQDSAESLSFVNAGTANTIFNLSSTGDFDIQDNGTSAFFVRDDGNVGIGTNSPSSKLDVAGQVNIQQGGIGLTIGADNNATTRTNSTIKYARIAAPHYLNAEEPMAIAVAASQASDNQLWLGGGSSVMNAATEIRLYTAANNTTTTGTERMRVDSSGNVGINTTGPDRKLDILDADNPQLRLTQTDATTYADFQMNSSGDLVMNVDGVSNQLVLDDGGSVGVGTTTPGYKLDVSGDINTTGAYRINGTDVSQYFITSAGTTNQVWTSDGSGAGGWGDLSTLVNNHDYLQLNNTNVLSPTNLSYDIALGGTSTAAAKISLTSTGNVAATGTITANTDETINGVDINAGTISDATWNGSIVSSLYGGTGANLSSVAQYSIPYFSSTGIMGGAVAPGTTGYVLATNSTGGAPSWVSADSIAPFQWRLVGEQLSPTNASTYDVMVGGDSTASATVSLQARTGAITGNKLYIRDTNASNTLNLNWNENDTANRTLNFAVGGGDRYLTMNRSLTIGGTQDGNLTYNAAATLTVEGTTNVNQDLTDDANPTFAGLNADAINIGVTGANTIDTDSGNLVLGVTTDVGSGTTGLRIDTDGAMVDIDDAAVNVGENLDVTGSVRLGAAGANNLLHTTAAGGAPSGNLYWGNRTIIDSNNLGSNAVTSITAGNGIAGTATQGSVTLDADLLTTTDGTGLTSSYSGLEFGGASSDKLALLQGCNDGETLKYSDSNGWACGADNNAGTSYTFTNGISEAAGTVKFGGNLTESTTLTQDSAESLSFVNAGTANTIINLSSTGDFDVQDNGTSALFVRDDGNIGIGTNAPGYKLDVNGSLNTTSFYIGGTQVTSSATELNLLDGRSGTLLDSNNVATQLSGWDQNAGDDFVNPMSAAGDIVYGGTAGAPTRLAGSGTDNLVLKYDTDTNAPYWGTDNGGTTYTASNGITLATADFQLGGALTQNTTITQDSAESLSFVNAGTANTIFNLSSTGDMVIQDNGTPFATFTDSGTFILDSLTLDGTGITSSGALGLSSAAGSDITFTSHGNSFTLPTSTGSNGYLLSTNGSGVLGWTDPGSLGGGGSYFTLTSEQLHPTNLALDLFLGGTATASAPIALQANTGAATVNALYIRDSNASNTLHLNWNENDTANRTLNLMLGNGDRYLTLNEDFTIGNGYAGTLTYTANTSLTVEALSAINQDLTTDASPTFAGGTLGNITVGLSNDNTITTSTGALDITPAAGSNLNVNLSTTGDFVVNTNDLYIDTSTGYVGIGDATPSYDLDVAGNVQIQGALILTPQSSTALTAEGTVYYDSDTDHLYVRTGDAAFHRVALDLTQYSVNNASVANGSYIEIAHNQNTNDMTLVGWVKNALTGLWTKITDFANNITQNLDNQFNAPYTQKKKVDSVSLGLSESVGDGADGAGSVTAGVTANLNTGSIVGRSCADAINYSVTALTSTTATVDTAPGTCLVTGDEVLLINQQGTNTAFGNVGNYEFLEVSNVSGTTVTFKTAKTKYYGNTTDADDTNLGVIAGTQRVMLQRVPNYTTVEVASTGILTITAWNGTKGGILSFRATGEVKVIGSVTAASKGYYGGDSVGSGNNGGGEGGESFCGLGGTGGTSSSYPGVAGAAGGGSYGTSSGIGGAGYCGGGGGGWTTGGVGSASAGGAGGGGAGIYDGGGAGGYGSAGTGGGGQNSGGAGGTNSSGNGGYGTTTGGGGGGGGTYGTSNLSKLFMGSGGGRGGWYATYPSTSNGGNGGGIIYIAGNTINVTGTVTAAGANGVTGNASATGAGGGGAGGSVKLVGNTVTMGTNLVTTAGGTGGAQFYAGGTGGVGRVATYTSSVTGSIGATYGSYNGYALTYFPYSVYVSKEIHTPGTTTFNNIAWTEILDTNGLVSVQTRSGATTDSTDGTWEAWRPVTNTTNILSLETGDTHTNWVSASVPYDVAVADGGVARNVNYYEDEDEATTGNITKLSSVGSSAGYAEATISSTDLTNYDMISAWVYATNSGTLAKVGFGKSAGSEQEESITIDQANTWQKVYWNIKDVTDRTGVTKLRFTLSQANTTLYIDNIKAEKLLTTAAGSTITSTANNYIQYRTILTTTNTANKPTASNVQINLTDSSGTHTIDASTTYTTNDTSKMYSSTRNALSESQLNSVKGNRTETALTSISQTGAYNSGTGKDGAIVVSSDTNINVTPLISGRSCADGGDAPNYSVTALTSTTATLSTTPSSGCLTVGDEILLINLQGDTASTINTGNYETLEIASISTNTLTFKTAKTKYYGENLTDDTNVGTGYGTQRVMLQRVPNYTNVTINSGINFYPSAWDGVKGGVIFFRASGAANINGTITVSARGYLGGDTIGSGTAPGGEGGESICGNGGTGGGGSAGAGAGGGGGYYSSGVGGAGYCGGGGGGYTAGGIGSINSGGAGGGGGGSAGAGGAGGYGTYGTGGAGATSGSNGGTNSSGNGGSTTYPGGGGGGSYGTSDLSKLYFGSGGGRGGYNATYPSTNNGGNGGGIAYIAANTVTVSGNVVSAGANGVTGTATSTGGGGGGAGGSIRIEGSTLNLGTSKVTASGGTGGALFYAGGTGGAGRIATYYASMITGTTSPAAAVANQPTYPYSVYMSDEIPTPNATEYQNLVWNADLNQYGKVAFQTRSGKSSNATDGSWEEWKPAVASTNYTTLQSANTHTDWVSGSAPYDVTVADGGIARNVNEYENEDEVTIGNMTKLSSVGSTTGYAEATIGSTNISSYDYLTAWVYATGSGNVIKLGMGESAGTEQEETVTIDATNTWQKVYWDLSDVPWDSRDAITKLRVSLLSTNNTVYIDNFKAEKLMTTASGTKIASTPNDYIQYRMILSTTNTVYRPKVYNVQVNWNNGYKIVQTDANTVRLYNSSGTTQELKLDAIVYGADLAEYYSVEDQTIGAGDVVALTGFMDDYSVPILRKATDKSGSNVAGIISTKAGVTLGLESTERRLLGLAGRVPVKIASDSAKISAGDFLAPSDVPGMAKPAQWGDMIIGKALEPWYPESGKSTVLTLINDPAPYYPLLTRTLDQVSTIVQGATYMSKAIIDNVTVTNKLTSVSIDTDQFSTNTATISGLIAGTIDVATLSAQTASISGDLYVAHIISPTIDNAVATLSARISTLESQIASPGAALYPASPAAQPDYSYLDIMIASLSARLNTSIDMSVTASESALVDTLVASPASSLSNDQTISLSDDANLDVESVFVSDFLSITGESILTNVAINGSLSVGNWHITTTESQLSFGDLLTLDSTGNLVTITGDLKVTGLADLNQLTSVDATISGTLTVDTIYNKQLEQLASQSADLAAQVASLSAAVKLASPGAALYPASASFSPTAFAKPTPLPILLPDNLPMPLEEFLSTQPSP